MMSCSVEGCEANNDVCFRLPNSKTRCKKWMETIKLSSKPSYDSVVCSAHFRPEDYGLVRGKVRLKPKVLPIAQNGVQKPVHVGRQTRSKSSNMLKSENGVGEASPGDTEAPNGVGLGNGDMEEEAIEMNTGVVPDENQGTKSNGDSSSVELLESSSRNYTEPKPNNGTDKDDIENILTNYYIKQNKDIGEQQAEESIAEKSDEQCNVVEGDNEMSCEVIDLSQQKDEAQPVIIEVPAEHGSQDAGARDCLMLLESVQVELDPNDLMLSDQEDDRKQSEPISLLSSSDDDDVIIEEPRVDMVVVSDATDDEAVAGAEDEEDVPLVRLIRPRPQPINGALNPFYLGNEWRMKQYYCPQCSYRTTKKKLFLKHMLTHSTIIYDCSKCEFLTANVAIYKRHVMMHNSWRRYQCNLCDFIARNRRGLMDHFDEHDFYENQCTGFECERCRFEIQLRSFLANHKSHCTTPKYMCSLCRYSVESNIYLKGHERYLYW